MVEYEPSKLGVAGSIPVSRSIFFAPHLTPTVSMPPERQRPKGRVIIYLLWRHILRLPFIMAPHLTPTVSMPPERQRPRAGLLSCMRWIKSQIPSKQIHEAPQDCRCQAPLWSAARRHRAYCPNSQDGSPDSSNRRSLRRALPRWLMAFFSSSGSSAMVLSMPSGKNTGS